MNIFPKWMMFDHCHPSQDWDTSCIQGCKPRSKTIIRR